MVVERYASVGLRRWIDEAVGPHYDALFLRLDLLVASREGRCGCRHCREVVDRRLAELVGSLPPL